MTTRRTACRWILLASLPWICAAGAAWAQTRVLKCVAADGSVSYLDARSCPGDAAGEVQQLREHEVTLTREEKARAKASTRPYQTLTPAEVEERRRLARLLGGASEPAPSPPPRATSRANVSYRCTLASETWYQHRPCAPRGGVPGKVRNSQGELEWDMIGAVPVKQEEISRAEACREIHRPAAILRRGRQLDERTEGYDKAQGKDKC